MESNPTLRSFLGRKHSYKEVFDFVRQKINEQGKPSVHVGDVLNSYCVYRGPNDIKCAAGHLISDEDMNKALAIRKEYNFASVYNICRAVGLNIEDDKLRFISKLQGAHDGAAWNSERVDVNGNYAVNDDATFIKVYNENMDILADEYNL